MFAPEARRIGLLASEDYLYIFRNNGYNKGIPRK